MSRRSSSLARRSGSPEDVYAKRRGETPYQIYFEISNIGRNVESSKKKARWKFCFGDEGREHEVTLVHSLMSGKKKTFFNAECINEAQKVSKEWSFAWSFGAHLLRVGINFEDYNLVIDGIPFRNFSRRDPYLAAQLEMTKRDSMRSLQMDEQRRFDRLGYSGAGGGGGGSGARSRAEQRRRPSHGSTGSGGGGSRSNSSLRAVSIGRSRDGDRDGSLGPRRRSSSVERSGRSRDVGDRRRSPPRSSSRRLQSGQDDRRGSTGSSRPRGSSRSSSTNGSRVGKGPTTSAAKAAAAAASAPRAPDILSADPSSLEVKGFDMTVPESSFDPLNAKYAAAAAATGGGATANGAAGGGSGYGGQAADFGYGSGGGFGGAPRGGNDDAQAVLQLGMEFGAMGMNSHMQDQSQYGQQQNFFDQGNYQRYDESGFPMPSQSQIYNNPPPQQQQRQQQQPPQQGFSFPGDGGGGGGGGGGFPGGYGGQAQQEHGYGAGSGQQGYGTGAAGFSNPPAGTVTDLTIKSSNDPWDAARAGMVNIDDITDTKHKPMVEVKPFTNDHRPLADLVRETPAKEKKAVMIDRPPPPPTHMAVAIVPVQPPGQPQQMGYAQGGYQQQPQNGNPFNQPLQLTQYGNQAQPILYTKPDDPFYNL